MWKQHSQAALLWLLIIWENQAYGLSLQNIVFPQKVEERVKRHLDARNGEQAEDRVSYSIETSNGTLLLNLQRNRGFVSGDFGRFTYTTDGGLQALNGSGLTHSCYYHGEVEGVPNSLVVLSTCHGLSGVVHMDDMHLAIDPVKNSSEGAHILYELDQPGPNSVCGVGESETMPAHMLLPTYYHLKRKKRAALATTSFVELGIVVDNQRYVINKLNYTAVEVEAIQLANYADVMFRPLNIRIVLTSLTIWSQSNPIDVDVSSAGKVLGDFSNWRLNTKGLKRTDISHLLIGHGSFGGVLGMAFIGTVCSPSYGSSISTLPSGASLSSHATVFAHEVGHVLGMGHDDSCGGNYIMHSTDTGAQTFSSCSSDDFESLIVRGGGTCLRNPPDPNQVLSIPVCGNKIVDQGEECDCGTVQECTDRCCNPSTCKLTKGSQCAQGLCCQDCQFKVAGTPCRLGNNYCDLPEYCNGTYGLCPVDVYKMNGYSCNNSKSYCFNGICQTYDAQCQDLFGTGTTKGVDDCFQIANMEGNVFGNCGTNSNGGYVKCSSADAMCGKLVCTGDHPNSILNGFVTTFYTTNKNVCFNADYRLGPDVPDPGMVQDGTSCGQDKACLNHACVNASNLGYNCDTKVKCNDKGVCNNKGNCHCDDGWAPPSCDQRGYGGSIDSGPAHIDTSLRDGLLIFFLLVLPILILIAVMVIKRDALRRRFCRRKRSSRANTQPATNKNVNKPPGNTSKNQPRTNFTDVFTISHNLPQRPKPPINNPQPPLRPPPPRPPAAPQDHWRANISR